jgi:hypothetical protein
MFTEIKLINTILSLIIATFVSYYSYKFLENPKNYQSVTFKLFNNLSITFVFLIFCLITKNYFYNKRIFDFETEQNIKKLQEFNYFDKKIKELYNIDNFKKYINIAKNCYSITNNFKEEKCLFESKNQKYNFYFSLTGDSHAESLFPMIYNSELYKTLYFDALGGSHFSKIIVLQHGHVVLSYNHFWIHDK